MRPCPLLIWSVGWHSSSLCWSNTEHDVMLTDIFAKRYPDRMIWSYDGMPRDVVVLLRQLTHVLFSDLLPSTGDAEGVCSAAHDQLARELGGFALERGRTATEICQRYLGVPWDLWNDAHGDQDTFFKTRISLVELIVREAETRVVAARAPSRKVGALVTALGVNIPKPQPIVAAAIDEINTRFRQAAIPLQYHAGVVQRADDPLIAENISEPFWILTRDQKWTNVDADIKEAIDRRDSGARDAALYALKAVESTIKIISDEKSFTRGTEKGAAQYIDNLVSSKNGRLIEVWEGEALKQLFSTVRNPHGHGPGGAPMPSLSLEQQDWVIESAMSWIKSLIRRA